jgi:hypothetical protein
MTDIDSTQFPSMGVLPDSTHVSERGVSPPNGALSNRNDLEREVNVGGISTALDILEPSVLRSGFSGATYSCEPLLASDSSKTLHTVVDIGGDDLDNL